MDLGAKAKAKGKYLFVWGKEAATYYQTMAVDSAIKEGGDEVRLALENLKPKCWSHPQSRASSRPSARWCQKGYFVPGGAGTQFTAAQAKWSNDQQAILYPSGGWIENEMKEATKAGFKMTGAPGADRHRQPEAAVRGAARRCRRAVHRAVPGRRTSPGGKEILRAMLSKEAATNFSKTRLAPTIVKGLVPADGFGSTALVSQTKMLDAAGSNIFNYQFVDYYGMNTDQLVVVELVPVRPDRRRRADQGPAGHHRQGRQRLVGEEAQGHVTSTMTSVTTTTGGRPRPAARRRRMPSWDRLSFMVVFLGLPLAIFLVFVIYPFVQALYYSMTDWSGFSPTYNFIGLDNFTKLFHDDIFMQLVAQQRGARDRGADRDHRAGADHRDGGHRRAGPAGAASVGSAAPASTGSCRSSRTPSRPSSSASSGRRCTTRRPASSTPSSPRSASAGSRTSPGSATRARRCRRPCS